MPSHICRKPAHSEDSLRFQAPDAAERKPEESNVDVICKVISPNLSQQKDAEE